MDVGSGHIRLYDLFRKELNLPDDKAAAFVLAVEDVCGVETETQMQFTATKNDMELLRTDCSVQFASLKNELELFRKECTVQFATRDDIHNLELRLEIKIEHVRNDLYKAVFLGGLAQLIVTLGAVLAIMKFMR